MVLEDELLSHHPAPLPVPAAAVAATLTDPARVLVVLDDDPTGTQSVADLPVLTAWDEPDLRWALTSGPDGGTPAAVYVLTNTRSLDPDEAARRNRECVVNALAAARATGTAVTFVSRSDSTLRGHFPLETDVIADTLAEVAGVRTDAVVVVPAFPDAGRVTIGGTHWVRQDGRLVPVGETEFARDATYGYRSSDLAAYVEEKTGGRHRAGDVVVLDLGVVRSGAQAVADALDGLRDRTPVVVDAVTEDDLRALALGLAEAERRGARLLYRVGPPFVRSRVGQEPRSPLTAEEVAEGRGAAVPAPSSRARVGGGLVVVGSHVGLTTRQLDALVAGRPRVRTVELDVAAVLDTVRSADHVERTAAAVREALAGGDVVLHTSRTLVRAEDPEESLRIARTVSAALVTVVRLVVDRVVPRFVVAKGGITSSDVATDGLGIRRAVVRGPMLPGIVSLWQAVEGPAAGVPFVVFAGNVGDEGSLLHVVRTLSDGPLTVTGHRSTPTDGDHAEETP